MPYSGNKSKINTNRAIVVPFASHTIRDQTTVSSSASIYVPFLVSEIQIRGIHTNFDADFREMYFTSSLVDGGPLGSAFAGILGDTTASSKTIKYVFQNPREINGSYDFTYHLLDPVSFYFPLGYEPGVGHATSVPTSGFLAGLTLNNDSNAAPIAMAEAMLGAPTGRVLFILEFIAHKD
jgi:hypothetical protein